LTDTTSIRPLIPEVVEDRDGQGIRAHLHGGSERFLQKHGITLPGALPELRYLEDLIQPLQAEFPEGLFRVNSARLEGLNYYDGAMLRISPLAPDGERYAIGDGGFTNWTARLLQNRKERLLTSGIGTEFTCRRYWSGG